MRKRITGIETKALHEMTVEQQLPTIATYRKARGLEWVEAILTVYLIELDESLNLARKLNQGSIDIIAQDIYAEVYHLSFEELSRFFSLLRTGKLVDLFQGLNSDNICRAAQKFVTSRSGYFANKSRIQSQQEKQAVSDFTYGVDMTKKDDKQVFEIRKPKTREEIDQAREAILKVKKNAQK